MLSNRLFYSACICAAALTPAAYAQDVQHQDAQPEIIVTSTLDKIVVTATRSEQSLSSALQPTIVIDQETIELSAAQDVAELLHLYANIDIGTNGGPGQTTSVFIRGTESDHVMLLIDGVRVNPATGVGPSWMHIDPSRVERIEIVKGPRSALYGSDAIGGVINIITKKSPATQAHFAQTIGSFNTNQTSGELSYSDDQHTIGINAMIYDTDGFSPIVGTNLSGAHDRNSYSPYFQYRGEYFEANINYWHTRGETDYIGFGDVQKTQTFTNSAGAASVKWAWAENIFTTVSYSQIKDDIQQNDSNDFATTRRQNIEVENDVTLDNHSLTLGLQNTREDAAFFSFGSGYSEREHFFAGYAQWVFDGDKFSSLLALRHTDYTSFGSKVTGNAEIGYNASDAMRLTAAFGTGFRAPSGAERFGFGANPDLEPETSRNYELGLQHIVENGDAEHEFNVSVFHNKIENLINFVVTDFTTFSGQNENIESARIRGIELGYDLNFNNVSVSAQYAYQKPINESTQSLLLRRAKRSGNLALNYRFDHWTARINMLASDSRPEFGGSNAGYALFGAGVQTTLNGVTATLKIDNILDKDYALAKDFSGRDYATSGRAFYLNLGYTFSE